MRLQCYEGLDESKAIYEWKYGKQLLYTQVLKEALDEVLQGAKGFSQSVAKLHEFGDIFFSNEFLEPRPLLKAIREENGCVLLIDEIDKADHEFESLLLEILSDYQISIPEIGTVKATTEPPIVFLTSNNTREISDALKEDAYTSTYLFLIQILKVVLQRQGFQKYPEAKAAACSIYSRAPPTRPKETTCYFRDDRLG